MNVVKSLINHYHVDYATIVKNMSNNKRENDPRVIRSRQMLREALVSLIPEMGYTKLTIQDIADRATLNRATFYLHYRDKNELLQDTFNTLIADVTPIPPSNGLLSRDIVLESITLILREIAMHADFFRVLLAEESPPAFYNTVRDYIKRIGLQWLTSMQPFGEKSMVAAEVASNYLGSAYLGVITWWLENGMPYPAEVMAEQLLTLTSLGLDRSLGLEISQGIDSNNFTLNPDYFAILYFSK